MEHQRLLKMATMTTRQLVLLSSRYYATASGPLAKTCLYDFHVSRGGKMVGFAGHAMPVQYGAVGITQSHLHTREKCSLFDVSHMLQTKIHGKDRIKCFEQLIVSDVQSLGDNSGALTVFTNEKGGIKDDLIVTKTGYGYLYVVSNAGCRDKDLAHMKAHLERCRAQGLDVSMEPLEGRGLVALQGPSMRKVLQPGLRQSLNDLPFMTSVVTSVFGIDDCRVTRCGYTGEDGVEISVDPRRAVELSEKLLADSDCQPAGLGARDTLRLEAGLCLYGNDIDETTTPVEAGLTWTIGKRRRQTADFPGAAIILKQIKDKPSTKRVGIVSKGQPARAGTQILDSNGKEIGTLTSGGPSPTLKFNISMGYVRSEASQNGMPVQLAVRQKQVAGQIAKMPFVPTKYFMKK